MCVCECGVWSADDHVWMCAVWRERRSTNLNPTHGVCMVSIVRVGRAYSSVWFAILRFDVVRFLDYYDLFSNRSRLYRLVWCGKRVISRRCSVHGALRPSHSLRALSLSLRQALSL